MSESCNHVTALLFRVEFISKTGQNVGTAHANLWRGASGIRRQEVAPTKPIEYVLVDFNRATYTQPKPLLSKKRASFNPITPVRAEDQQRNVRMCYFSALSKCQPTAVALGALSRAERVSFNLPVPPATTTVTAGEAPDLSNLTQPQGSHNLATEVVPSTLPTISTIWDLYIKADNGTDVSTKANDFVQEFLPDFFSRDENNNIIDTVEAKTRLQSSSEIWKKQRGNRITASNFGEVFKRQERINKGTTKVDHTDLCNRLRITFGGQSSANLPPALRWGHENEQSAKDLYVSLVSSDHDDFEIKSTGLLISSFYPFLGASPDGLVTCTCHPDRLLEIKCPFSKRTIDPKIDKPDYLTDKFELKRNHNYFYQVQGQLGIWQKQSCDFFVWTPSGHVLQTIMFEQDFFEKMEDTLQQFYTEVYVPIIFLNAKPKPAPKRIAKGSSQAGPRKIINKGKQPMKKSKKSKNPVTVSKSDNDNTEDRCPICRDHFPENPDFDLSSVNCDGCDNWYHFVCAGFIKESDIPAENDPWYCSFCLLKYI